VVVRADRSDIKGGQKRYLGNKEGYEWRTRVEVRKWTGKIVMEDRSSGKVD
jgi:hypothetical protein